MVAREGVGISRVGSNVVNLAVVASARLIVVERVNCTKWRI